jgi:hypothetical protein
VGAATETSDGEEATHMNPYSVKVIADLKIEEEREWAANYRIAEEADRARRAARRPAGSWFAGLLRTLASAVRPSRPVFQPPDTAAHTLVDIELARKVF